MKQLPFLNPQTSPHRLPEYTKTRTKDEVLGLPLIKRAIDSSAEKGRKYLTCCLHSGFYTLELDVNLMVGWIFLMTELLPKETVSAPSG